MNVYKVVSENTNICDDCNKDINKINSFYMFVLSKNNEAKFYLCRKCKDKLKNILNAE